MQRLKAPDALRGIFAVSIVLLHYNHPELLYWGRYAVSFFFMLSGFMLQRLHPVDSFNRRTMRALVLPRLTFIYLVHWLALFLFLMARLAVSPLPLNHNLFFHVALLQSWVPDFDCFFGYNDVSWFLSVLVFCYVMFPLLSWVMRRLRFRYLVLIALAVIAVVVIIISGASVSMNQYLYVCPAVRWIDFALGMLVCEAFRRFPLLTVAMPASWRRVFEVTTLALGIILSVGCVRYNWFGRYNDLAVWWLPVMMLVACCMPVIRTFIFTRVLAWRPFLWLGSISLEIYAFQHVAGVIANIVVSPVLAHFGLRPPGIGAYLTLAVLVPLAWVLHRFVITPLHRTCQACAGQEKRFN